MGDKWTTSGGWRLKAKQNRSFAGRAMHRYDAAGSTIVTDVMKKPPTSNLQNISLLYQRNAGVQGSYSAYADPIARRAVVASFVPQPNSDNAPCHPIHPTRLQNELIRRIRDPHHNSENMVQRAPIFHDFSHQSDIMYPINRQVQQNPSIMRLPFHGTSVTPSLSGTATLNPFEPCFEKPICCSFEPDSVRLSYSAMELYHRSHLMPLSQNNASNVTLEAHSSGLARFQRSPKSARVNGTRKGRSFLSPEFSGEILEEKEGIVTYASPSFEDFGGPFLDINSHLSHTPSKSCNGDENYVMKGYGSDLLYPNANSKRLFLQRFFQNDPAESQVATSTSFQIQSPPKLNASITPDFPFDWDHSGFDPHVEQEWPFSNRNSRQRSDAGIKKFQTKHLLSAVNQSDHTFLEENNVIQRKRTAEEFEISFHKMGSDDFQKEFGLKHLSPDDVHPIARPLRHLHATKTIKIGDTAEQDLLNIKRKMYDNDPSVRHRKIRFFNEGIEVDFNNRPLSRSYSLESVASSAAESFSSSQCNHREPDDGIDLAAKKSMWGNFNV